MAIWRTTQEQRERLARVVIQMRNLHREGRQIEGSISERRDGLQCYCADGVFAQVLVDDGVARWEGYHTRKGGGVQVYRYDLIVAGHNEAVQYLSTTFSREYFGFQGIHWMSPLEPGQARNFDPIALNDSYHMTLQEMARLIEEQYLIDPREVGA